jgi:23S rRNA (guanosine2251-2'-O)-methyltransferase
VHQGVLLEAAPLPESVLEDFAGRGLLMVLDQVTDPHNIGAVMRSCAAFGARALVVTERHAPATTGALAKAASGALEHVPLIRVGNLARALETIAAAGHQIIGLAGDAATDIAAIDRSPDITLVLGAEGKGLRRLTREKCDHIARLGTSGPIASLNVSNAAAVALYICRT